jgi:predicted nucleic acid-binding protein
MAAMLDTCIIIDFPRLQHLLPSGLALSAVVLGELAAGARTTPPGPERDQREQRLEWARTFFEPYPFDADVALTYGRVVAATQRAGRSPRPRIADLMIAATAAAHNLPLYTSNANDFIGLNQLVEVITIKPESRGAP